MNRAITRRSMSLPAILAVIGAPVGGGLVARAAGWPWLLVIFTVVLALVVVILSQRRDLFTPFMENVVESEISRPHDETKRIRYTTLLWLLVSGALVAVVLGAGQWGWAGFTLSLGGALVYHGTKAHVPRGRGRAAASAAIGGFLVSLSANFIAGALAGETNLDKSVANIDTNVRTLLGLTKKIDETTTRTEGKVDKTNEQLALILKYLESQKQSGVDPSSVPVPPDVLAAAQALMNSKDARERAQAAIVLKKWDDAKKAIDAFNASPAEDEVFRNKTIEGDFYFAQARVDDAIARYEVAFALRPDNLQARNNLAISLPDSHIGDVGSKCQRAVEIHRGTLIMPELTPMDRAATHINLGNAMCGQALASEGGDRVRLLQQAVLEYRDAPGAFTPETGAPIWAVAQNGLGMALSHLAESASGPDRARLFGEATSAYRESLRSRPRDTQPEFWAMGKINLGNALRDQATATEDDTRIQLLVDAAANVREAIQVMSRDATPWLWASAQNSLGACLAEQALQSDGLEKLRLLNEAASSFRGALTMYSRDSHPAEWAGTQNNLGMVLGNLAIATQGAERCGNIRSCIRAFKAALRVWQPGRFPEENQEAAANLERSRSLYESSDCATAPGGVPFDDIPPAE